MYEACDSMHISDIISEYAHVIYLDLMYFWRS